MSCYISSRENRFYGAKESLYGQPAAVVKGNEFNAIRLNIREQTEQLERRDKTGTRTFRGTSGRRRKTVEFSVETYFSTSAAPAPQAGFLVEAALGAAPRQSQSGTATLAQAGRRLVFANNHGLTPNQAVATASEVRFVEAVPSETAVVLNAPLPGIEGQPVTLRPAITYSPSAELPSVTLYDYWAQNGGIHRLVRGGGVDRLEVEIAGDFHTMRFQGGAAELLDSASFEAGQGGLSQYPAEPTGTSFAAEPIPGHLGQLWLGPLPERIYTLTKGKLTVDNGLSMRNREFGSWTPTCLTPGERTVTAQFEMYARGTQAYRALYQASRTRTPISLAVQLGEKAGQMCCIYFPAFVPEVPEFQDQEERQLWSFGASRAQGSAEDEIHVAFA
jgi:hypothetical protein